MRYTDTETTMLAGKLSAGSTATIVLVDMKTNTELTLSNDSCTETPIDGMFTWDTANVTVGEDMHVLYCMTDTGGKTAYGKVVIGGDMVSSTSITNVVTTGNEDVRQIIEDVQLGSWALLDNQMVMKTQAGDELARFDLFDQYGRPTMASVFKRERV